MASPINVQHPERWAGALGGAALLVWGAKRLSQQRHPLGAVLATTGAGLIWLDGFNPLAPWLIAVYALYAVAGACWIAVVRLQIRASQLAREAALRREALPVAYFRVMRAWYALGWPAFLALIFIVWLMVAKPGS